MLDKTQIKLPDHAEPDIPTPSNCLPSGGKQTTLALLAKRVTDIVLSLAALVMLSPLFIIISLIIRLDSKGPIIFKQSRIGLHGRLFDIFKFRTMQQNAPQLATDLMLKLDKSPITKAGSFLRKTSLDELPQLVNVLCGDMSIVGPRPALFNQNDLTAMRKSAGILRMPPGITGWAQINGRDDLTDAQKVEYDRWYCDNWCYKLDWQIILATIRAVISKQGAC